MKTFSKLLMVAGSLVAIPAMAATQTWNLNSGTLNHSYNGNVMTVNGADGNSLQLSGWSDTGGSGDSNIQNGKLSYSSSYGLMLQNRDEDNSVPSHSIDNYGDDYDMVLLSFEDAINLEGFSIGWATEQYSGGQADVTIAAFTGAGDFSFASSDTWSSVFNDGWSTVAHYGNVSDYSYQAVDTDLTSKYWLIGAYNPIFTGGDSHNGPGAGYRDGMKLAAVTGSTHTPPTTVPEPGALAILAAGFAGLVARRKKAKA
ncbi:exosortase-dependent surface protein XDP1 [Hahella ganghwensis]|uniref:exosortase-dependent surface protein XDP1 n=1 Tax=Hahella ganghwensis TaxID=286420 RepID=UPI000378176D|nr:exosortase-dependent surface protein XDP1 [Hahella ganghwensis]